MRHLLLSLIAAPLCLAAEKPNFVVILTDDLGYSDLGCYGSEIETPTLDRLADNGLRFSQFYNTAKCHSTRVSLLTGRWCRQAGDEALSHAYTIPEVLKPAGYTTLMTGKWHLKKEPTDFGFEHYFGHLSGACHYFKGDKTFRLNGKPWQVPNKGFYTTVAKMDYALDFLGEARKSEKPWFLYIAFNAPHAPIHALKEDYEKYKGKYDQGWDKIRESRIHKQQKLGLLPEGTKPSPRPDHIPTWDSLSDEVREWESKRMAGYAAMIDRVDQELGRLVNDLEKAGELDNTVILFLSDNGACPYDRTSDNMDLEPYNPETRWSDSTGWAWARNTPFQFYKQNQFEGGISTPAILHWPKGLKTKAGSINREPVHLVDVLPTLAELGEADLPDSFPGRELRPLVGTSLTPIMNGGSLKERPPIHFLFGQDRALRDGKWKLVSFRSGPWELYDMSEDRTELNNLADEYPDRVKKMAAEWHSLTKEVLHAPANEQKPVSEEQTKKLHPEWSDYSLDKGAITSKRMAQKKKKK